MNFIGYHMEPSQRYCKAIGEHPKILFANREDIREINLDNGEYRPIVSQTRSAIALDYDYQQNSIYYADVAIQKIYQASFDTNVNPLPVVGDDFIDTPDGLAFDWVHKNLYWTDTGLKTVSVVSLGTHEPFMKTLIHMSLDEPRAIVVDPRPDQGWLYWSDWGTESKIERSGLDGSHRQTIVSGDDIQWPNGMTIGKY